MKLIFTYIGHYRRAVALAILIKLAGTCSELLLPYILEHIIDHVVPARELRAVLLWGAAMFIAAIVCRALNVAANRRAIENAHRISYEIRQALFEKTARLDGAQFDAFGLPSLISRMTSDSYNVQSAVQQLQSLCVRAPIILIGGIAVSMLMDPPLAMILVILLPLILAVIVLISGRGIPMYTSVQRELDRVVRIMREDITGIRVVKALSKEEYEKRRFDEANRSMAQRDIAAATVMAIPGPLMQLLLNTGLTAVVLVGAARVNSGEIRPGVILAFLTYFNMIAMGVMGLNRIFMTISKASASADRIAQVLAAPETKTAAPAEGTAEQDKAGQGAAEQGTVVHGAAEQGVPDGAAEEPPAIVFDHVDFRYGEDSADHEGFVGETREMALSDIHFTLRKGESLGIIGPTGCGKTTIVNLLLRFYDPVRGSVSVDGRDVRTYEPETLRRKFGVVFQNDLLFHDTLRENIDFGRGLTEEQIRGAVRDAMAETFIAEVPGGLEHVAAIRGADLSGGQKQRICVARALAADPEILILDDSSSALDYRTDAQMRAQIAQHHGDATLIMVAQRVSSVMNMTRIMVLDSGRIIGYGDHRTLMETCPAYREICEIQMGALQNA